ncbi:MAG: hypothetical protein ABW101_12915 [Candidatus Thiodiazotropha sp.]
MKQKDHDKSNGPHLLKPDEAERLLKDAKEASAWMRAEIKRRRDVELTSKMAEKGILK